MLCSRRGHKIPDASVKGIRFSGNGLIDALTHPIAQIHLRMGNVTLSWEDVPPDCSRRR